MVNMIINPDILFPETRWQKLKYFLKQGHLLPHMIDRFKWHHYPKWHRTAKFPTHLDLESTNACQMSCPMCYRHKMDKPVGFMDFNLYKRLIDEGVRYNIYSVKLSWRGEPLLHPKIIQMVEYAKKKGVKEVAFLTNAERLNEDMAEGLIRAGLDWFSVSFDGLGETYNKIRKPAVFEETVAKVIYVAEYKQKHKLNRPFTRVQTIWWAVKDDPKKFMDFWKSKVDRVLFLANLETLGEKSSHDVNFICQSPWQRMNIIWSGKVAQCHSDYPEFNILGDANTQSLYDIWHGKEFQEVRNLQAAKNRLKLESCRNCSYGLKMSESRVNIDREYSFRMFEGVTLDGYFDKNQPTSAKK